MLAKDKESRYMKAFPALFATLAGLVPLMAGSQSLPANLCTRPVDVTISVAIVGTNVVLTADGEEANYIRVCPGPRVTWDATAANSGIREYSLAFERVPDDKLGPVRPTKAWPFIKGSQGTEPGGGKVDDTSGTVTEAKRFNARAGQNGTYKYTITALPTSSDTPIVFDPIIIIER